MSEADKLEIVRSWFRKAENDLLNAEHTMTMEKPPCDTVCFRAACMDNKRPFFDVRSLQAWARTGSVAFPFFISASN